MVLPTLLALWLLREHWKRRDARPKRALGDHSMLEHGRARVASQQQTWRLSAPQAVLGAKAYREEVRQELWLLEERLKKQGQEKLALQERAAA